MTNQNSRYASIHPRARDDVIISKVQDDVKFSMVLYMPVVISKCGAHLSILLDFNRVSVITNISIIGVLPFCVSYEG